MELVWVFVPSDTLFIHLSQHLRIKENGNLLFHVRGLQTILFCPTWFIANNPHTMGMMRHHDPLKLLGSLVTARNSITAISLSVIVIKHQHFTNMTNLVKLTNTINIFLDRDLFEVFAMNDVQIFRLILSFCCSKALAYHALHILPQLYHGLHIYSHSYCSRHYVTR